MNLTEIDEIASAWLARRDGHRWSEVDQSQLESWLEESTLHRVSYLRLQRAWQRMDRLGALQEGNVDVAPSVAPRMVDRFRLVASMAAAIALTASLYLYGVGKSGSESADPAIYATAIGGHEMVPLSDGSKVELNTDTTIRADLAGAGRRVWLDKGEAYFEVAHDRERPFVVDAGARRIVVLGTKFSVRRDGERIEVAVIDGKVRVEEAGGKAPPKIITRGDIVIAKPAERNLLVLRHNLNAVENDLSWRDGVLTFDSTSLADAVAEFNRYNRRKMIVPDPVAAAIRIEGTFTATDGEAFARMLREAFGLHVDISKEDIIISG